MFTSSPLTSRCPGLRDTLASGLTCCLMLVAAGLPLQAGASAPAAADRPIRVGVLSSREEPGGNTSQGLFIRILNEAGLEARAVSGEAVRDGALDHLDVFIIGGGSGTRFNTSLGPEGGKAVEAFVRRGGGVLGSCAGGYSFVRGHNEALKYVEVANARCIDTANNRWARGKAVVDIAPEDPNSRPIRMYYANGPLWEITDAEGFGITRALATFVSDVADKEGDQGGVMPGTPAILAGTFGDGRFVLFSAHPEFRQTLGNRPLVVDAAHWVARGRLAEGEDVVWREVFPSTLR